MVVPEGTGMAGIGWGAVWAVGLGEGVKCIVACFGE